MSSGFLNYFKNLLFKTFDIIVDEVYDDYSIARFYGQAPLIDGIIYINEKLSVGKFYKAKITKVLEYDLEGEILGHYL